MKIVRLLLVMMMLPFGWWAVDANAQTAADAVTKRGR